MKTIITIILSSFIGLTFAAEQAQPTKDKKSEMRLAKKKEDKSKKENKVEANNQDKKPTDKK